MFGKKAVLVPKTEMTLGEFDPTVDGAYRNVKSMPLDARPKRDLFLTVTSTMPVDLAISDSDGRCIWFKDQAKEGTFGPIPLTKKETLALMMGVFRGDLAEMTVEVWIE